MSRFPTRLLLTLSLAACGGASRSTCVTTLTGETPADAFVSEPKLEKALAGIDFHNKKADKNLSDATVTARGELVVVSDEGSEFALSAGDGSQARTFDLLSLASAAGISLGEGAPSELDLEGVAVWENRLVMCGSASLKRVKPKEGKDNAARMAQIVPAAGEGNTHANQVFVLDVAGAVPALTDHWDLRALLLAQPVLQPFRELPSKDNGIDVEGIAADAQYLYFGLRGPVLRGHALIVRTDWKGQDPQVSFLNLDGLGIRGLLREPNGKGWFVLAGPTMELHGPFSIYAWDGHSSVFADEASSGLTLLSGLHNPQDAKPEALFAWHDQLCILRDGPKQGGPACATPGALRWP